MSKVETRSTNIELLRIVAMVLIVSHHFAVHGGFDIGKMGTNGVIVSVLSIGGKIGVNLFILISGFYSSTKNFPTKKMFKICEPTIFYSIVLYTISVLLGIVELRKKEIIYAIFPQFFGGGYWFVVLYLEICMLMPILNRVFDDIKKEEIQLILVSMILLFCVLPQLLSSSLKINDFGFSTLGWYILVYLIGAYLKRYGCWLYQNKIKTWIGLVLSILVFVSTNIVKTLNIGETSKIVYICSNDSANGIFPVIISLLIFICFQGINVKYNKLINKISATTFGVYLLHDNKNFSEYLWNDICGTQKMTGSHYFLFYALSCILGVFVVCSAIEYVRGLVRNRIQENIRSKSKRLELYIK